MHRVSRDELEWLKDWVETFPAKTCSRARCVTAILATDGRSVLGFNHHIGGARCIIEDGHCVSAIHAEAAAVASAAAEGIYLLRSTAMLSQRPCNRCLAILAVAGVNKVYYLHDYHSKAHGKEYISKRLMEILHVEKYVPAHIEL